MSESISETPNPYKSLYAIAHNLKKLVEEVRELNENAEKFNFRENERLSENG